MALLSLAICATFSLIIAANFFDFVGGRGISTGPQRKRAKFARFGAKGDDTRKGAASKLTKHLGLSLVRDDKLLH